MHTIIVGGGCFWWTEAGYSHVKGVTDVTSGYMGGYEVSANYKAVCGGDTGHVEVIKVDCDETIIPLETVLDIFFATPDPTAHARQGLDVGRQYATVMI